MTSPGTWVTDDICLDAADVLGNAWRSTGFEFSPVHRFQEPHRARENLPISHLFPDVERLIKPDNHGCATSGSKKSLYILATLIISDLAALVLHRPYAQRCAR